MRFRVGQYNILANCLADNLKPWFWYGYAGIQEGQPYRGDGFDAARVHCFGFGRSAKLIQFWTLMKKYIKIFHTEYEYVVHLRKWQNPSDISSELIPVLHKALIDFFHRDNLSSPEGDKDLPYHLFASDRSREFKLWDEVVQNVGLRLAAEAWANLDSQRTRIEQANNTSDRQREISQFNTILRAALVAHLQDPETTPMEIFKDKLFEVATFVCPSNNDISSIFAVQDDWSWNKRCELLVNEICSKEVDVWAVQELDELATFRSHLSPYFVLAVFKLRAITSKDDGVGLFYNPKMFDLVLRGPNDKKQQLPIGGARFSGMAAERGKETPLRRIWLPLRDGEIPVESEYVDKLENGADLSPEGPLVPLYVFTDKLRPTERDCFDERVAVFAILTSKTSGVDVLFCSTHLYHSQNDPLSERIRGFECKQLDEALDAFCQEMGVDPKTPRILLGDLNDAPDVAFYGRPRQATPAYQQLVHESGWSDVFWPNQGASSSPLPGLPPSPSKAPALPKRPPSPPTVLPTPASMAMAGLHKQPFPSQTTTTSPKIPGAPSDPFAPPPPALAKPSAPLPALPHRPKTSITLNRQLPLDYILVKGQGAIASVTPDPVATPKLGGVCPQKGDAILLAEGQVKGAVYGPPMMAIAEQPAVPSDHVPVTATVVLRTP